MNSRQEALFNIKGKKVIIAGACGGFGMDISSFLYECGAQLLLIDTNKKKLENNIACSTQIRNLMHICFTLIQDYATIHSYSNAHILPFCYQALK